jgi:outer membrane receptor protein involved in Fe transport
MTAPRNFVRAVALAAGAAVAWPSDGALAQQAAQPASAQAAAPSAQEGGLEEIIITARKREESLQDAPIQVDAISKERIEQLDATSLEKIASISPQLFVARTSNGSGAQITMRGIGSSSTSIGLEQSVAVVLDGVYFGQGRVLNEGLFDLQQVEILKGPQALFFGKNATAGVISLTTAKPTAELEAIGRTYYEFESQEVRLEGIVSGPLTDTLGGRLAFRWGQQYDGLFRNRSVPQDYTNIDVAGNPPLADTAPAGTSDTPGVQEILARGTLQFTPSDAFTASLTAAYTSNEAENSGANYVIYRCPGGFSQMNGTRCRDGFHISQNRFPQAARTLPFARSDGSLYNDYESYSITANVELKLGAFTLTSVSNWQHNDDSWACDCDFQSEPGFVGLAPSAVYATELSSWRAASEELRLLSDFDKLSLGGFDVGVNFMLGFLFQDTDRDFQQYFGLGGLVNSAAPRSDFYAAAVTKVGATKGQTYSPFAQLLVELPADIELAAGVRYTRETKDSSFVHPYLNPAFLGVWRQNQPLSANQKFHDWSPEATLTWHATPDLTVYAAYKTAYKSGGFSISGLYSAAGNIDDFLFAPETVKGGEIGVKSTLLDGQARLNATAYWYRFDDLQVDFFNAPVFAFTTLNAGKARTRGFEVEGELAPSFLAGLTLRSSAAFNDAKYLDFVAPCWGGQTPAQGCNLIVPGTVGTPGQDISGRPTTVAPKWSTSYGIAYEGELAALRWGAALDGVWSDDYLASTIASPHTHRSAYATLNLTAHLGTADGMWDLALLAKNLTNEVIVNGGGDAPNTPTTGAFADQIGLVSNPRTVALQLTFKY